MKKKNNSWSRRLVAVVVLALAASASAATFRPAQLVRDIETTIVPASSNPRVVCARDDNSTLVTVENQTRTRLWRTNGTAASTVLIKDLGDLDAYADVQCLYQGTSGPQFLLLVEAASASVLAVDAAGTSAVEVLRGTDGNWPALLGVAGVAVFSVPQPDGSTRLVASDGTVAGTAQIATLTATASGFPAAAINSALTMGGKVYFGAGGNLWETNGTSAGTHVSVTLPPSTGSDPYLHAFGPLGSRFVFSRLDGDVEQLWVSDGTGPGTLLLATFGADQDPRYLQDVINTGNGLMVFTVRDFTNGNGNGQLWRTDGTAAGTVRINSAPDLEVFDMLRPLRGGLGGAVFQGITSAYGREPWVTDGTDAGTRLLRDLTPGPDESFLLLADAGAGAFVTKAVNSHDVWYTDGTPGGTWSLSATEPRLAVLGTTFYPYLTVASGTLFVSQVHGSQGFEIRLWRLTPATRTITLLREFTAPEDGPVGASLSAGGLVHGLAVLAVHDAIAGFEPWATDGTVAGTSLIKDLAPQVSNFDSAPRPAFALNGMQLLHAMTLAQGSGLWRSDGTAAGTFYLGRGAPIFGISGAASVQRNGAVIYPGVEADGTVGLWRSDGTASGTSRLQAFTTGGFGTVGVGTAGPAGCGEGFVSQGNSFYFGARTGVVGKLYRSDGTASGTTEIGGFAGPTGTGPNVCVLASFGGEVYFTAADPATGVEVLWRSNGLAGGQSIVQSPSNLTYHNVIIMRQAGNSLYFIGRVSGIAGLWRIAAASAQPSLVMAHTASGLDALSPNGTLEALDTLVTYPICNFSICRLMRSDGTPVGTFELTGPTVQFVFRRWACIPFGGKLLFQGGDGNGLELWITDGSIAGTHIVKDIIPGVGSSKPRDFIDFNGLVYFQFDVQQNGEQTTQLWRTDGTDAGTERVNATPFIYGTQQPGLPPLLIQAPFGVAGDSLYFGAHTLATGTELYSVENEAPLAAADPATTPAGTAVNVNVLGNDSDPDGAIVSGTLRVGQAPANGTTAIDSAAGSIRYTPNAGFSGSDSFTYQVADRQGRFSSPASVNVTVVAATVNGGGSGGSASGGSNGAGGGGALGVLCLLGMGAMAATRTRCRGTNRHHTVQV